MTPISIVHIHSDPKFLKGYHSKFNSKRFKNTLVFIGPKESLDEIKVGDEIICVGSSDVAPLAKVCNQSDMVILYDLDPLKAELTLLLADHLIIIWRFFGRELYSLLIDEVYSPLTRQFISIKVNRQYESLVLNASSRIDHFACICQTEYDALKRKWPFLPPFLQFPRSSKIKFPETPAKKDLCIVGNSASPYNNHFDLLPIVEEFKNVNFLFPLSYAQKPVYTDYLIKKLRSLPNVILETEFVSRKKYQDHFVSAKTAVFNSCRQHAFGNINLALRTGVKVYLNEKNPLMKWLKSNNIKVFNQEELRKDFANNNYSLNNETILHNQKALLLLSSHYSYETFTQNLVDIVQTGRKPETVRKDEFIRYKLDQENKASRKNGRIKNKLVRLLFALYKMLSKMIPYNQKLFLLYFWRSKIRPLLGETTI